MPKFKGFIEVPVWIEYGHQRFEPTTRHHPGVPEDIEDVHITLAVDDLDEAFADSDLVREQCFNDIDDRKRDAAEYAVEARMEPRRRVA